MTRTLNLSSMSAASTYACHRAWPDFHIQAGDHGVVFTKTGTYLTAFFEAFPREPATFIRGEGATIEAAEADAWAQYQAVLHCPGPHGHEFERRGYENGAGFCIHCNLFNGHAFEPSTTCVICGTPTCFTKDARGASYCEAHQRDKPLELWTKVDWYIAKAEAGLWNMEHRSAADTDTDDPRPAADTA